MSQSDPMREFKTGLSALQHGDPNSALIHLQSAVEHDSANPYYLSFYGLALARAKRDWAMAEDFCLSALRTKRTQPHFYLNLAEVCCRAGELEYAVSTLYNGLQHTKKDERLVRALEQLGVRRPPVLSFLDRRHFLNRQLGKLRHRLCGRGSCG